MSQLARLLAELRRRRVFRVAVAYAGAVFIILQAASLTFDALGLGDRAYRWLVLLSIAGFPVAVILAWFLDLSVTANSEDTPRAVEAPLARRPRALVTAMGIVILALAAAAIVIGLRRQSARVESTIVAVLPFKVSAPGQLSYLEDGVVDLLSRNLDGAEGLRTIAPEIILRAVARAKKEAGAPGNRIAQDVGAAVYVDGSIHQSGDSVRIYAQFRTVKSGSESDAPEQVSVQGDAARVLQLVDRLTAELLAVRTGGHTAPFARTAALTTASL